MGYRIVDIKMDIVKNSLITYKIAGHKNTKHKYDIKRVTKSQVYPGPITWPDIEKYSDERTYRMSERPLQPGICQLSKRH